MKNNINDEFFCIYKRDKYCLITGLLCHKDCSLRITEHGYQIIDGVNYEE